MSETSADVMQATLLARVDVIMQARILEQESREAATRQHLQSEMAAARAELNADRQALEELQARIIADCDRLTPERPPVPVLRAPQTAPLPNSFKINMPKEFNGSRPRVPSFIYEVETFVQMKQLEESIMTLLPALLTGVAAAWWQSLQAADSAPDTWEVFKHELVLRFGDPKLVENMREELSALKPGRAASLVRGDLERILVHLPALPESERIWHFKSKLLPSTRYVLEQHDPQTLNSAYELAETVERAARLSLGQGAGTSGLGRGSRGSFSLARPRAAPWTNAHDQGPVPMELNAMRGEDPRGRAPLTEREMRELRKNGGCFICRKPNAGHWSGQCPEAKLAGRRGARPGNGRGRGR